MGKTSEQFSKKEVWVEKWHMKRYSTSFVFTEMQNKTTRNTTTP